MMLIVLGSAARADEAQTVAWHTELETAWSAACRDSRPLLLFVTRDDCTFCTRMKDRTFSHPGIAAQMRDAFVPLVLDGRADSPLLKELKVACYPSTFVISPQAVVLLRVDGYLSPIDFGRRLTAVRRPASASHTARHAERKTGAP